MSALSALLANCRTEVVEPTAGFWSDAEFKAWLNIANNRLTTECELESTSLTSISTVSGTELYNLASDFDRILRAEREIEDGSGNYRILTQLSVSDRLETKGTPLGYYLWQGSGVFQIGLIPVPDLVKAVRVYYYVKATTLTADGDTPVIPSRYHHLLEKYAVAMALQKQQDPAFQVYLSQYEAGIIEMKRDVLNQQRGASQFQTIKLVN